MLIVRTGEDLKPCIKTSRGLDKGSHQIFRTKANKAMVDPDGLFKCIEKLMKLEVDIFSSAEQYWKHNSFLLLDLPEWFVEKYGEYFEENAHVVGTEIDGLEYDVERVMRMMKEELEIPYTTFSPIYLLRDNIEDLMNGTIDYSFGMAYSCFGTRNLISRIENKNPSFPAIGSILRACVSDSMSMFSTNWTTINLDKLKDEYDLLCCVLKTFEKILEEAE